MINKTVEEKYYNGEYLEFFANYLVSNRFGKLEIDEKRDIRKYVFNRPDLNGLEVTVEYPELYLLGYSRGHHISIRGQKNQVEEFRRAAEPLLEKGIYSLKEVRRQLKEKNTKID